MKLRQITEAAWWETLKRQTPASERQPRTTTRRKRALKFTPPESKEQAPTVVHSGRPGDVSKIQPRKFSPEKAMQGIVSYVKRHPEYRRDVDVIIQNEVRRKRAEAKSTATESFKDFTKLAEEVNPEVLSKITQIVRLLTLEQLKELLVAI